MKDIAGGEIQIPTYRLFEIDQMMNQESSLHYQRSAELKKWTEDFKQREYDFCGISDERLWFWWYSG